jgi:hypothetical protein
VTPVNVPRWLLIAGIVIIVLGFLSCGIGIVRDGEPDPSEEPSPRSDLDVFPASVVSSKEVALSEACSSADPATTISFTGTCHLTVQPGVFIPKELRMDITGTALITTKQVIRDKTQEPPAKAAPRVAVRVSGSSVDVFVTCTLGQCTIKITD